MRYSYIPLLMAMALLGLAPVVHAQGPSVGGCSLGTAQADLDANNVSARVFNNGSLFYGNGSEHFYYVPQASGRSPVYASGLWVGGKVGGELRVAGGTFGAPALDFTFWPGPLGSNGRPVNPASCASFDRIYQVTQEQVAAAALGNATGDVAIWPVELGAPYFVDLNGNGIRDRDLLADGTQREPRILRSASDPGYGVNGTKINIAAGQLPDVIGTQGVWWVMNDVGNVHPGQATGPLGIEVQVLAFSFSRADALGNTTFYKYRIINKSGTDITDAYVSIFADPDLGDAGDDQVGADIGSGLVFVYNNDNQDATGSGTSYGTPPPAVGYDFFQGPIVPDGPDEGTDDDTLSTSAFSYFTSGGSAGQADPDNGIEVYNYQQGLWADGSTMRAYGDGFQETQGAVTRFAYPGDPVTNQAWSAVNPGPGVPPIPGGDRRFALHTGGREDPTAPGGQRGFTIPNGKEQDIVFGIVFAVGQDNLDSITAMRNADKVAQAAFDIDFNIPPPPPPPPLCVEGDPALAPGSGQCFEARTQDGQATLVWGYPPTSSNYLGRFSVFNGFLRDLDVPDKTYDFEGFNIYKYSTSSFEVSTRQLIATFDVINGVTQVREVSPDPLTVLGEITARGTDSGLRYSLPVTGLTNYTDYFYGITAYSYNAFSTPKANESSATLLTFRPTLIANDAEMQSTDGQVVRIDTLTQRGSGTIRARVVDPTAVTGATYEVRFFKPTNADGTLASVTTYSVVNVTTGQTVVDGQAYYASTGTVLPQGQNNIRLVDGLAIDIGGAGGFQTFVAVRNASGALVPAEYSSARFPPPNGSGGFPFINIATNPTNPNATPATATSPSTRQQSLPPRGRFIIQQGEQPDSDAYETFLSVVARDGANFPAIDGNEFEWRFTGTSLAYRQFEDRGTLTVPFELWNIGKTEGDASDDVRMIPIMRSSGTPNAFDLGRTDHAVSGGTNDPFSDLIYWYMPKNEAAGQAGYNAYASGGTANADQIGRQIFSGMVLVGFNAGAVPTNDTTATAYNQNVPETGTVFRIVTNLQNQSGDVFRFNTAGLELTAPSAEDRETALDRITAVPNPYFGTSSYESGNLSSVIRFTNLPQEAATIRIFTVSGSLVTTLNKTSSSRSLDWNLQTSNNLPVASGMYLVHVEIDGVGERTLKLAVINRRTQVTIF